MGGDLVSLNTEKEVTLVKQLVSAASGNDDYWMGMSDKEIHRSWKLVDGNFPDTLHFASGEPNGDSGGLCAVFLSASSYDDWDDAACDNQKRYVCELPGMFYEK